MKRCTTCRRVYDRDAVVCAVDGSNLDDFVSDPLVGRAIAKRYRLVQRLGGGSLGTVYLAAAGLTTGRPVAVKILAQGLRCDEDTLKQCRWDARFAAASHPAGIVRVYEVDRTDEGQIFVAMDYLDGESLADLMHREGRLELVRALRLASQIAQALAAAFNAGVIHSEIKPHNVMVVGPEERVKLTDFGIGRLRRIATGASLDRPVGVAHEYAAPEQILGGEAVDRTDVYGLGAVLYAMLTGAAPPRPSSAAAAGALEEARQIIRTLRPDVPAALEHLLMQTMAREPERRPSSMTEVAEHLLDVTASLIAETTAAQARFVPAARATEPSASSRRVVPLVLSEPAMPRSYAQWWRSQGEALRQRWQSQRQAHREQWRAQREHWQAHHEASVARREQRRSASQASRERRRTQRERRRLAWRATRERWQAQWLAYQARRRAGRERRQLARQARWQSWQAHQDRWLTRLTEPPRRLIALARRRRDEGLQWTYANGRALAASAAGALVVAGAMAWTTMYWRAEKRAEAPARVASLVARDSVSGGELGIDAVSQPPGAAPQRLVRRETGGTANLTPSRPVPVATPGDDRPRSEQIETARAPERVTPRSESPLESAQPPAEPTQALARVGGALSWPQIARIQAQAEQKLRHRGLLRVSAADRWGVTIETAPSGEVALGGVLRDMALYDEAVRLVREVPGVRAVRGSVEVSNVGPASIVQSDTARIQAEIQQKLRSRGLLRESTADRWGVTVEVNPDGDVILVGAVRDVEMYSEAMRRAQEVARVRQVKQDIKVMERDTAQ